MITIMKHGFYVSLFVVFFLFTNIDARGGGGSGSRGRSSMHRGGGGFGYFERPVTYYGDTFGNKGLPKDSYIYKDYYQYSRSNGFLINSLFYGAGIQDKNPAEAKKYYESTDFETIYRNWNMKKDTEWRETTRAPYFDNKLPGDDKIFPASAVVGAATAFGLVSLLPLNVPPGKPLMYCGNTDLIQSKIQINYEDTYVCKNKRIEIECMTNSIELDHEFVNEVVQCDLKNGIIDNIYCSQGTLFSKTHIYCDKSSKDSNDIVTLNCQEGQLPKSQTSFIPTTSTTTEYSFFSTTPKPLSFSANVHIFLLKLMGKSDVLETTTPESFPYPDSNAWHPEALTIPPETTSTTQRPTTMKPPYEWMQKIYINHDDGTFETTFRPIPKHLTPYPFETDPIIPPNFYKIYTTSTELYKETSTKLSTTTTTTEAPYVWMIKVPSNNSNEEDRLEPLPEHYVEIIKQFAYIPDNWVKVPLSKAFEIKSQIP